MALVVALLMLMMTTLLGVAAVNRSSTDTHISGNQRVSVESFYVAESGVNELKGRFTPGATSEITDTTASNTVESTPPWRLILAKDTARASQVASALNVASYTFVQSLQNQLDFGVEIKHKVDASNNIVKKGGVPVYILRSYGSTANGARKIIELEMSKLQGAEPQGAIYTERPININGSSTYIQGTDACGTQNKPGIASTLPNSSSNLGISGNPTIDGTPKITFDGKDLSVQFNTEDQDLRGLLNRLKDSADYTYSYGSNQTLTGYSDQWGTPTNPGTETPITYDGAMKIVYFDMNRTNTLKLSGGSHGAGILLVNGNLELNGGFTWYGVIIVTGALDFTGGGQKNVTGGVMTGETATVEIDVGGNAGIIYCSSAVNKVKDKTKNLIPAFRVTRWKEVF